MMLIVFLITVLSVSQVSENLTKARELFFSYHKGVDRIDRAIAILEKETGKNSIPEVYCLLSRAWLTKGDLVKTKSEKIECYQKGSKWAEKGLKLFKKSPCLHFWYAANLGRLGDTKGKLKSLSLVPKLKKHFSTALKLKPDDPEILDGIGVFYVELPRILGGSIDKGIAFLKKAIEIDPSLTVAYLDLGYAYIKKGELEKAKKFLKKVLETKNPRYYADWYMWDKPKAEELLRKIGK